MEGPARSSTPPSSASLCPACRKPIDPIRAGSVAILDGAFRYFCNAQCKSEWVDTTSKRPTLDAMTADPPPVVASGVRSPAREEEKREEPKREESVAAPYFPSIQSPEPEVASGVREIEEEEEALLGARERVIEEPEPVADESPSTLRSPSVVPDEPREAEAKDAEPTEEEPKEEDSPKTIAPAHDGEGGPVEEVAEPVERERKPSLAARAMAIAPAIGIGAGLLAAVVSLAGDAAGVLRLPLAIGAAMIAVSAFLLRPRDPSAPSPWVVAGPIAAAGVAAGVSRILHDAHADAHAAFVGLAAAAALIVDVLTTRVRRDVLLARSRVESALEIPARVVRGDATTEVEASQVRPGEQLLIEAGEVVAVDGIISAGSAEVAPWLDSPVVTQKREGDAVVAGAMVISGRIRVNATFSGVERAWLRLISAAPSRIEVAAPLVAIARRFVERGAPVAALIVAGATFALNGSWFDVAIAACAGGFALSAFGATAAAALAHARAHVVAQRRGIVYKDAEAFDTAGRADVAVVCSRGTILLGEPEIVAVEAVGKSDAADQEKRVLALAAGAELSSSHPFAAAVLRAARARGVRPETVRSAIGHSGRGMTALAANGDKVIVGNRAFLLHEKVSVAIADARVSELEAQGRSVLLVALGEKLVGLLALQDGLRPGARAAVQRLHDARIEPVLLSGEARDTCETIARALDIEHVRPEILPSDRATEVRALVDGGHVVAAMGHASSDDGALGAADVSIAMSAAGAAPGEWGVALASDDVRDAALALTVPRKCRERARLALGVGLSAQAAAALVIAFGLAPPAIAPVLAVLATAAVGSIDREPV